MDELASSCAVDPGRMRIWIKLYGKVPSHVALLLWMREQDYIRVRTDSD